MSVWTHITACLSVDTYRNESKMKLKREVQEVLKNAPKITGSEKNADIFINIQSGHNVTITRDCEHCKYKDTLVDMVIDGVGYQKCDAPDGYVCRNGEYQSCIVISVQGDLRDRIYSHTKREFEEFLEYVKTHYHLRDYSVNIEVDI